MRRRKRNTILRIALGLAIAAIVPATALAKPVPVNQDVESHVQYQLGPGEIPYLSQDTVQDQVMGLGVSEGQYKALGLSDDGVVGKSSDDRAVSRATPHGVEVASVAKSPDDRSFSKATTIDTTPVVSDDGRSIDFNPYTVTGFVLALLMALGLGMGIAVWHSRRTHLSPA
ncbi:MAG TPA: hypothetical protein VJL85_00910 [Gaiellaceae bacterium]|nr:hypothetical protein [Gaiellaceae bacterium]